MDEEYRRRLCSFQTLKVYQKQISTVQHKKSYKTLRRLRTHTWHTFTFRSRFFKEFCTHSVFLLQIQEHFLRVGPVCFSAFSRTLQSIQSFFHTKTYLCESLWIVRRRPLSLVQLFFFCCDTVSLTRFLLADLIVRILERVQKTPSPNLAQLFVQLAPLVDVVSAIAAKTDKVRDVMTDKVRGVTTDKVMVLWQTRLYC